MKTNNKKYKVMKTLVKYSLMLMLCTGLINLTTSCRKENRTSTMTVKMTDAPGDYLAVNVEVIGMDIHYFDTKNQAHEWVSLNVNKGVYNLLDLQNDVTVTLAQNEEVPLGEINQMRLILGSNNSLVLSDSSVHYLKVPSGEETGIKININQEIKYKNELEVVIDFDAHESVVEKGNGEYNLKPVIKLKSVIQK